MSGPTAPREAVRLLTLDEESRLFLRLRATLVWETVRSMVVGSRLRLSLVVMLSSLFWGALYGLFVEAFSFLEALHADVISLLFNTFCVVHCVFEQLDDTLTGTWALRQIAMGSTSTRRAPRCFDHLHMLRKMRVLGLNNNSEMGEPN